MEPVNNNMAPPLTSKGELVYKETTRLRFFAIPWPFRHFEIYENDIVEISGLLSIEENDCYMYKVADVKLTRTFLQRIMGLSTIICYLASDASGDKLIMKNIKHGKDIKDYILSQSEKCRLARRTVNTQNLSYQGADMDGDGIPDMFE
ncbi:PH domain-containing protein [Butyrivibrio sp. MC2013]|uniref:PH domain-containing protein n=1 Tax=Butyrivibrio sp. MC2013 TaxID=1280686 RepID=UPI0004262581|nr:PH domain-containing protein [Butyrivibrio sp. MC2013]